MNAALMSIFQKHKKNLIVPKPLNGSVTLFIPGHKTVI